MTNNNETELTDYPILIVIPVFNDWQALELLLIDLDKSLLNSTRTANIFVINDASRIPLPETFLPGPLQAINKIDILELRRNLGHQRAIAIGLAHIEANVPCKAVVVMDGDGEDNPEDVPRLIEKYEKEDCKKLVFARRNKRKESRAFRSFYALYRYLYKLFAGQDIRIGNFSIIPYEILQRLVVVSEIWNHYAAGVLKSRVPYTEISTNRSSRLAGYSKMNFVSLVMHGLSSISVFGDVVGTRLLISSFFLIASSFLALFIVVMVRFATNLAIPGWATYTFGLIFVILMQAVMISLCFIFIILSGRNNFSFLPRRDYPYFVLNVKRIFTRA